MTKIDDATDAKWDVRWETTDRVLINQDDQPPHKYCFSHKAEDLTGDKCDWCGLPVQAIIAQELKHGR